MAPALGFRAARWACRVFLAVLFFLLPAAAALASCLPVADPLLLPISAMLGRDPAAASRMAGSALAGRGILPPEIRGRLLALQAEGYGRLSQATEARRIALQGLELPLSENSEARAELLWIVSTNTFRAVDLVVLRPQVEHAAVRAPDTGRSLCLAIALGSIHRMSGDFSAAARQLFDAYRRSEGRGFSLAHAEATRLLARLWSNVGNDTAALELNQAVIDFETAQGNDFLLAMAHGFRGIYLNNLRRFPEALQELERAGASHRRSAASVGAAYVDKEFCRAFIGLAQWQSARRHCMRARAEFARLDEAGLPHAELLLAEIGLAEGRTDEARARLDALIAADKGPALLNAFEPFRLRAEANQRTGDLAGALADLHQYIDRYRLWKEAATARQTLILAAQFAAGLQAAKAETLQRTLHAERNAADAKRTSLLVSVAALILALAVFCRLHYLDIGHRRRLVDMANTDPLTGLPNRRHILDRATALLAEMRASDRAFSVALVDLDHFKAINDTYGHLAGDLVLKGIAAAARAKLPAEVIMGRWGGEEFLIVFPGHGPADCVTALEDLRREAGRIKPHPDATAAVGFSAGIAGDGGPDLSVGQIIDRADTALYRAKTGGRGRTCLFQCREGAPA
ncbi:UNVERIFIED_ORG: diguanylate cyclase (plasmid) [Roseateles sp. XES5]|nr:GGDEF domain-containing protein [Roseateles sp. XES5]